MSGHILRVKRPPKFREVDKPSRYDTPDWYGSTDPDIVFVIDPLVGREEDDEAPQSKRPISKRDFDFIAEHCRKYNIPTKKCAIIRAAPPITAEMSGSQKKVSDHLKIHRETFSDNVSRAKPKVIVAMGKSGASQVLARSVKITQARGMPVENKEFNCIVFPSLGAGHVIRIPENQRTFDADFQTLGKIVDADFDLSYQTKDKVNYRWCTNLAGLLKRANQGPLELAVDTETFGLRYYDPKTKILTVQISIGAGSALAIPIDYNHLDHKRLPSPQIRKRVIGQLKLLLEHRNVKCFGQNFKFDYLMLKHKLGITVRNYEDDTICLMHGIDENMMRKDLDEIVRQRVPAMMGYADEFNRDPIHQGKTRMDLVPPPKMLQYGCGDADATYRVRGVLKEELRKDKKAFNCYQRVVMPGLRAFAQIEDYGFPINLKALREFEKMLRKHQAGEYKRLKRMVPPSIRILELDKFERRDRATGKLVKPASITRPGFLRAMLFHHPDGIGLEPRVFTPSTRKLKNHDERVASTSAKDHLTYFEHEHPFVSGIMDYIRNEKLLGTYVGTEGDEDGGGIKGFYKYLFNGRIRPTYLLHRAVTGRTSSADPNGQNFPKRGKLAKKYREIFVAPPGYVLLEVDFSQLELRIAAIMSRDPVMLRLYREGADIHTATACAVMGITLAEFNLLDKETRDKKRFQAKAVNFGFLYGMGWRKFMNYARTDYGVTFSEEEAQEIRKAFFRLYKNLGPWHNSVREFVRENGYVRTYDGRVRHLPSVFSPDEMIASSAERQAINSPVQAFGSDLGLMALQLLVKNVSFDRVRPIGFIHDAIVCIAKEENAMAAAKAVKYWMEHIPLEDWFKFRSPIPIVAEASVGKNLSAMIEIDDAWYKDKNITSYYDVQIKNWENECAKATKDGKPLPPKPLPARNKLVRRRKLVITKTVPIKPRPFRVKRLVR